LESYQSLQPTQQINVPKHLSSESASSLLAAIKSPTTEAAVSIRQSDYIALAEQAIEVSLESIKPDLNELFSDKLDLYPFQEQIIELLGVFVEGPMIDLTKAAVVDITNQLISDGDISQYRKDIRQKASDFVSGFSKIKMEKVFSSFKSELTSVSQIFDSLNLTSTESVQVIDKSFREKFDRDWSVLTAKYTEVDASQLEDLKNALVDSAVARPGVTTPEAFQQLSQKARNASLNSNGNGQLFVYALQRQVVNAGAKTKAGRLGNTIPLETREEYRFGTCSCRYRVGTPAPTACSDPRCGPVQTNRCNNGKVYVLRRLHASELRECY